MHLHNIQYVAKVWTQHVCISLDAPEKKLRTGRSTFGSVITFATRKFEANCFG